MNCDEKCIIDDKSKTVEDESVLEKLKPDVKKNIFCYCNKERSFDGLECHCHYCRKIFHLDCIAETGIPFMPFVCSYFFICKSCNTCRQDYLVRRNSNLLSTVFTAVANLYAQSGKSHYSEPEIFAFIKENYDILGDIKSRSQLNITSLAKSIKIGAVYFDNFKIDETNRRMYGFLNMDNYVKFICPLSIDLLKKQMITTNDMTSIEDICLAAKIPLYTLMDQIGSQSSKNTSTSQKKLKRQIYKKIPTAYPSEHPYNKDGYRYYLTEPDPIIDKCNIPIPYVKPGKAIPAFLYRCFTYKNVELTSQDRAATLKISNNRKTVTGDKGYSVVRPTNGAMFGNWYYEVSIDKMKHPAATRIGWSTKYGNLQAPCGYDKFGYSWRSIKGTKFHDSRGKHYSDTGYGESDILGMVIRLPSMIDQIKNNRGVELESKKNYSLIRFKSYYYFEHHFFPKEIANSLEMCSNASIEFFLNGKSQGIAYDGIYNGKYYPTISLYKNSTVTTNFGPNFVHTPPPDTQPVLL
ncbi:hypothetical protein A3Q56_05331 [Intoshia linei]|uniref:B30.2/SPRY domain-containing protein n=1 Tax=Intoshia linei TaxID=1819745 RepID=A0A177AY70_9BILA|nr:hypothetical protein A3Q56_05331 [Intoshia linei]